MKTRSHTFRTAVEILKADQAIDTCQAFLSCSFVFYAPKGNSIFKIFFHIIDFFI